MEYLKNDYGYMQACFYGKLEKFEDSKFPIVFIKKFNFKKNKHMNLGKYEISKAKDLFGNFEIILAYIDNEKNLNIILEDK